MNEPERGVDGAVLAGGRSSRMGTDKNALPWGNITLLEAVIERLRPQVDRVLVSGASGHSLTKGDVTPVADSRPGHGGPLIGIQSCLAETVRSSESMWLAVVPCDAPFLPDDLVRGLLDAVQNSGRSIGVIRYQDHVQPTFSIWHRNLLAELNAAIDDDRHGIMAFLDDHRHAVLDWPSAVSQPFFNVNSPADLEQARALATR